MFNRSHIETIDDVTYFFKYVYCGLGVNFHPDDGFDRYIYPQTKQPAFSEEESKIYDHLREECFVVCENLDIDIYDHALTIISEFDR